MSVDLLLGVSSEGVTLAEAEIGEEDPNDVIEQARGCGVELLWVHSNVDLSSFGFSRANGYLRMRAEVAPGGESLPELTGVDYPTTLENAYRGLWGHKRGTPDTTAPMGCVVLGLPDGAAAIGLCRVFTADRLVDGPGVVLGAREPRRYARLLSGACALLGPGPIEVDSWGDDLNVIQAYTDLGFAVIERIGGWELRLSDRARRSI